MEGIKQDSFFPEKITRRRSTRKEREDTEKERDDTEKERDESIRKKSKLETSFTLEQRLIEDEIVHIVEKDIQINQDVIESIDDELKNQEINISSWITFALRSLMTYGDIRNRILTQQLEKTNKLDIFDLGETFPYLEKKDKPEVEEYLSQLSKDKISIFTASNFVDPSDNKDLETHFQSFIYHPIQKKLYIIDPALHFGSEYQREIANQVIIPYFIKNYGLNEKNDIKLVSNYCQMSTRDVFCQTWTLILLLREISKNNISIFLKIKPVKVSRKTTITHPKKKRRRIGFLRNLTLNNKRMILKDFFVEILKDQTICKKFKKIYNESIDVEKGEHPYLKIKDPCEQVQLLKIKYF